MCDGAVCKTGGCGSCAAKGARLDSSRGRQFNPGLYAMGWNPSPSPYVDAWAMRARGRDVMSSWTPAAAAPYLSPGASSTLPARAPALELVRSAEKQMGAIPGGWTQTEWDKLSETQKQDVLKQDAATQDAVRKMISSGIDAGVAIAKAAIDADQRERDRQRDLELARIKAKENTDIARIQAAAGQTVTGTTNTSTTSTTNTTPTQMTILPSTSSSSSSSTGVVLAAAAAGGILLLLARRKRRR